MQIRPKSDHAHHHGDIRAQHGVPPCLRRPNQCSLSLSARHSPNYDGGVAYSHTGRARCPPTSGFWASAVSALHSASVGSGLPALRLWLDPLPSPIAVFFSFHLLLRGSQKLTTC